MTTLKYTGQAHFREIGKADFSQHGVDQNAIKVARHDIFPQDNHKNYKTTIEVSDEAATWLLEHEAGEWEVVEDEDQEKSQDSPADEVENPPPSASDAPDGVGLPAGPRTPRASKKASS